MLKRRLVAAALALSGVGVAFITGHEGVVYRTYLDPVGIPTICVGHTSTAKLGQTATPAMCDALLLEDTTYAQDGVKRHLKVPVTQEQYDATVSFVFNVGVAAYANSTLLRLANEGKCMEAGAQFPRWNKAKGRVLKGLTARRAEERALWESGC